LLTKRENWSRTCFPGR